MAGKLTDLDAAVLVRKALSYAHPGQTVGLGTGHAATAFIRALGERGSPRAPRDGRTDVGGDCEVAREVGIPLVSLEEAPTIDLSVDGADEVDPSLDLIKGYGGALAREKVVAAASRRLVILVGRERGPPRWAVGASFPSKSCPSASGSVAGDSSRKVWRRCCVGTSRRPPSPA